jgi:hypothetical protein
MSIDVAVSGVEPSVTRIERPDCDAKARSTEKLTATGVEMGVLAVSVNDTTPAPFVFFVVASGVSAVAFDRDIVTGSFATGERSCFVTLT